MVGGFFEEVGALFISIVPAPVLMQLQQAVDQVALANGVSRSEHPYSPNISIARFDTEIDVLKPTRELIDRMSSQLDEFCQRLPRCQFQATELKLFESVSGHYTELSNFQLKGETRSA
jgi:2'-5' RNA ligase